VDLHQQFTLQQNGQKTMWNRVVMLSSGHLFLKRSEEE
jgi:hypothetical protein